MATTGQRPDGRTRRDARQPGEADLVLSIYDAALDRARWRGTLEGLARHLKTREAFIAVYRPPDMTSPQFYESANAEASVERAFLSEWVTPDRNPWLRAGGAAPPGAPVIMERYVPRRDLEHTAYWADFLRPSGIEQCLGGALAPGPGLLGTFTTYLSYRDRQLDRHDAMRMARILPHLQRALQLQTRLAQANSQVSQLVAVLDQLSAGVLVLDGQGRVIHSNPSAEAVLATGDGLTCSRCELAASTAEENKALRRLVTTAARTGETGDGGAGGTVQIPRLEGRPLSVLVTPLGEGHARMGAARPAAVVFVTDPERAEEPAPRALTRAYGLTPTETTVALAAAKGDGIPAIAEQLGISRHTARTHLYRIFGKTGVRRQAQLARLLASHGAPAG